MAFWTEGTVEFEPTWNGNNIRITIKGKRESRGKYTKETIECYLTPLQFENMTKGAQEKLAEAKAEHENLGKKKEIIDRLRSMKYDELNALYERNINSIPPKGESDDGK